MDVGEIIECSKCYETILELNKGYYHCGKEDCNYQICLVCYEKKN